MHILSYSLVTTGQNITKFLHKLAWTMAIHQIKHKSLAVCTYVIYGYIMFSAIVPKCIFGDSF